MGGHPAFTQRRSIRLRDFDYATPGAYFVTLCSGGKRCLFGEVCEGEVLCSPLGITIGETWIEAIYRGHSIESDTFVVMPNHLHAVVILAGTEKHAGVELYPFDRFRGQGQSLAPTDGARSVRRLPGRPAVGGASPERIGLPDFIRRFKSFTAARCRQGVTDGRWERPPDGLWQRNYYEHVIRDEEELRRIREYVENNPIQWEIDRENQSRRVDADAEPWEA